MSALTWTQRPHRTIGNPGPALEARTADGGVFILEYDGSDAQYSGGRWWLETTIGGYERRPFDTAETAQFWAERYAELLTK